SNLAFWEVAGVHLPLANDNSKQRDKIVIDIVRRAQDGVAIEIDIDDIPDLAPIFGVLLARLKGKSVLKNCARLKIKECDRLAATAEILNKFGIKAVICGDDLEIYGGTIKGGVEVDSYGDHRMAMMAAIMASFAKEKVVIKNAQVCAKSYPDFWEKYLALGGDINVINIR
ncbi:MAG TPA: 3-phosphoshikimate 1-carboxyvinyltransferase, partial [Clostridia bacterium]|nr:3-phosphoshikimate 1-carboxyvinyltransferase [Clostridia bacterium]